MHRNNLPVLVSALLIARELGQTLALSKKRGKAHRTAVDSNAAKRLVSAASIAPSSLGRQRSRPRWRARLQAQPTDALATIVNRDGGFPPPPRLASCPAAMTCDVATTCGDAGPASPVPPGGAREFRPCRARSAPLGAGARTSSRLHLRGQGRGNVAHLTQFDICPGVGCATQPLCARCRPAPHAVASSRSAPQSGRTRVRSGSPNRLAVELSTNRMPPAPFSRM